jgi:signal transduction histidine kinase
VRHELLAERRQLERNLHDGAQQRLVALALDLKLVQAKLADDPQGAGHLLAAAREELALAIEELRELARGLHPAILTERGLRAALEALARRAPMQVRLETPLFGRLPEPVETAAYYLVAEALTNATKHAEATEVVVRLTLREGRARIEIGDDGIGGADFRAGGGLHGLADRLAALGARLEVDSPPGGGTSLTAEIPLQSV